MVKTAASVNPRADFEDSINVSTVRDNKFKNWAPKIKRPKLIILPLKRHVNGLITGLNVNFFVLLKTKNKIKTGKKYENEKMVKNW